MGRYYQRRPIGDWPRRFPRLDPSGDWLRRDGRGRISCVVDLVVETARFWVSKVTALGSFEFRNAEGYWNRLSIAVRAA